REPGENPGLPRSGKRERPPRRALALRGWEAVDSRNPVETPGGSRARRPASIRRRETSGGGSTWKPRGRRVGPARAGLASGSRLSGSPVLSRGVLAARGGETGEIDADRSDEEQRGVGGRERGGGLSPDHDAGAQAERLGGAGGRQQDRPRGQPLLPGSRGRRRPAGGDQDHQRPLRRRYHPRARSALDPDRGRPLRGGAAVRDRGGAPARNSS